ncbi:MAG: alpha/beta hydrolase [Bulleidia sp.]|nr:alpha/beta hydrolase [Bulleidia sp.]
MLTVVLIIAVVLFIIFCAVLAHYANSPSVVDPKEAYQVEESKGYLKGWEDMKKVPYTITSFDGYQLNALFVPAEKPSDKYVIISHGYTWCLIGSVKYLQLFRKYGFNCVLFDQRGHGDNKRTACTLGLKESRDLMAVINDTYKRYGKDIVLGLHGESMGSGTQINALQYHPDVKFIVNDCGYAELVPVLQGQLKLQFHLPGWLTAPASVLSRIMYGYSWYSIRPIDALADNEIPICFMHGEKDTFIPPVHSQEMAEKTKGYQEVHIFKGSEHAVSIQDHPKEYEEAMHDFLVHIHIID